MKTKNAYIQEVEGVSTSFGHALYIKVRRYDGKRMTWTDICRCFNELHPDKWAVQFFPPFDLVLDEANVYHLYVLDEAPIGVNINKYRVE